MLDKLKVFNKVKIDTDKYIETESNNNENLKSIMFDKLKSSERLKQKRKNKNMIITVAASLSVLVIGIGITNPSLADNIIKNINEFKSMLDKVKESVDEESYVEYNPDNYPEREEEKEEHKKNKLIATPINVSSKDNNIEINLSKAMYDKKKIYLDMNIKTDKLIKESELMEAISESPYGDGQLNMYLYISEIYINNIKQDSYGYSAGIVEFIDDNTINLSYLIDLDINNNIEDANFKINFGIHEYKNQELLDNIKGNWSLEFNIKSIDDKKKYIDVNEKNGDYILKNVELTKTYIALEVVLPFTPALGNPHNNFIIVLDPKGNELTMSQGIEGKVAKYIYELETVNQDLEYIDIIVVKDYMNLYEPSKYLSSFKVNLQ